MDMLSLLMNSLVFDEDGDCVGEVVGFTIVGNKMVISTNINADDDEFEWDDPDGGEEVDGDEDIDDEADLDPTKETGNIEPLRMVVNE